MDVYSAEVFFTYDGEECDIGYGHQCDAFMSIFLNDVEDYVTPWIWDSSKPKFDFLYASTKVRNTTVLKIELHDRNNQEKNELLERWIFNPISKLNGVKRLEGMHWSQHHFRSNKLYINAVWNRKPDYEPLK